MIMNHDNLLVKLRVEYLQRLDLISHGTLVLKKGEKLGFELMVELVLSTFHEQLQLL